MSMRLLVMLDSLMLRYVMPETVPVVPELVLMRQPFWLLDTVLSEKTTLLTVLSDLPPTLPMLRPWPPEHIMPDTLIVSPDVTATQSSWFLTVMSLSTMLVLLEMSKPSELCAAASLPVLLLGASPAELSSVRPDRVRPSQLVISKQCVGQFWITRFDTVDVPVTLLRTKKWSGLDPPPLQPSPSHHAPPLPSDDATRGSRGGDVLASHF